MSPPSAATAPAVRARTAVPTRPLTPAPRPRRISGPVRPASRPPRREPVRTPSGRPLVNDPGLITGLLAALQRTSNLRLLDRLIRGRTWIVLVAFALIGIVTLQLGLLKLNAGIGRSLERSALLQRENAALSIENSELSAGNRVEATAAHLGMRLVAPGALRFLSARPHVDVAQAAASLAAPVHSTSSSSQESSSTSSGEPSSSSASSTGEQSASATPASSEPATTSEQAASASPSSVPSAESTGAASGSSGSSEASTAGSASSSPAAATPTAGSSETTPAGGTQAAPGG